MTTSIETGHATEPVAARVSKGKLFVDLADGRTISVPLEWYPRLADGTPVEWRNLRLSYAGIHWPDLDEDISVEGLLAGYKSMESPRSLRRWRKYRALGQKVPIPEIPLSADEAREFDKIVAAEGRKKSKIGRRRAG
jgi:hypothetical protein